MVGWPTVFGGREVWGQGEGQPWCCCITVDSATTPLQNGSCPYRCISKQMHCKTPFSHNGYMKSLEFYENYITLVCPGKNKLFDKIILTQNHAWHIIQSGWINYLVKQQIRNKTILSSSLFTVGMHSIVMFCFMAQTLQDPLLCSST
jgi:hypothetical protein